jgi:hypothetical protein
MYHLVLHVLPLILPRLQMLVTAGQHCVVSQAWTPAPAFCNALHSAHTKEAPCAQPRLLCRDDSGAGSGTDPQERRRSGGDGGFTETNTEQGPNYKGKGE